MKLLEPNLEIKDAFYEYINEWKQYNEKIVPTTLRKVNGDYEDYVERWSKESRGMVREGWVANTTFFLVNDDDYIVGSCNMRHELNDKLLEIGGHVGYGVRPTERGKGYATVMLKKCLEHLRTLGVKKALVTCNNENAGSKKVILKNGGIQDESFVEEDGTIVNRFWINLEGELI
ncbi:GNAT family N-acetyltransferase [Aquisalibacillus elongatus]|uniref:Putative acetyltransferase n=1 Tax=Aquisalibacillus elongatus TaxID=485577 RepID=A0A3N5BTS2_9BACI|nr:GNAT family N-acetyltransferase [Aquisalibacillus elongatus]RPF53188.1 putative acetyltransferase [Aquisalibacillus elongatus]